eukprot:9500466-Pyramimonas_sp.AAC.1
MINNPGVQKVATVPQMEGGPLPTCGSRLSAARTLAKHLQEFHGLRAVGFQKVVAALSPRTL